MMKSRLLSALSALFIYSVFSFATPLDDLREAYKAVALTDFSTESYPAENFLEISNYGDANDLSMLQLYLYVTLPDEEVGRVLDLFDYQSGCFTDIDYENPNRGIWPAGLHVTRMQALAKVYATEGGTWYKDTRVGTLLHKAIIYWGQAGLVNTNWWHNEIGIPRKFTSALLLIRDELSPEEIQVGLKVLEPATFGMTGQNKIWRAINQLMKGLLIDDEDLVREARDQIGEEICVTEEEGIQPDWSYHQHGHQLQFGNYGLAFVDAVSFWVRVLHGSDYDFTPEQIRIVDNYVVEGLRWSMWKGIMDPNFYGRQSFPKAGRGKAYAFFVAEQNMAAVREEETPPAVGAKFFPRSDVGIFRTSGWEASVRMHSCRTVGYEFDNKENQNGWFSADGTLLVMESGEEYEDIAAVWDWRRLPGVTAYDDGKPLKTDNSTEAKKNNSAHVGGAVLEDARLGNVMFAVMEVNRDSIYAMKSYFFLGDVIVALGSGVGTDREGAVLSTGVEQSWLSGKVAFGKKWAWHRHKGYVSLDKNELRTVIGEQTGSWELQDPALVGQLDTGMVFKCYIEHDSASKDNSYAYAVLPAASKCRTKSFLRQGRVKVVRNDLSCQAVKYRGKVYAVLHEPETLVVKEDSITFETPAFAILKGGKVVTETQFEELAPFGVDADQSWLVE